MIRVQNEFQGRVAEIEAYFEFIGNVDHGSTKLTQSDGHTPAYSSQAKDDLLRTFRATAFLLLYNLMESTVTNAVEAIFDELDSQGVSFDDCKQNVRAVILDNLKSISTSKALPLLSRIATDIVAKSFRKEDVVSGNVDAALIRGLAAEYGFHRPDVPQVWAKATSRGFPVILPSGSRLSGDGSSLRTVKDHRNSLAHGNASFSDVGKDYTQEDLIRIKCEVISYLDAMLQNVSDYLATQMYRV